MTTEVLLLTEEEGHGGVSTMVGLLETALQTRGWAVQRVNVRHSRPSFMALLSQARQASVLVASNNFLPAYWTVLLGLLTRRPSVVWVHGPLAEVLRQQPASRLKLQLMRWTYLMANALVFNSKTSESSLAKVFPETSAVARSTIPNPAPELSPLNASSDTDEVHLGFVGRLSAEKQPQLLLEMLTLLPKHFQLTLVGDGPMRQMLEKQALSLRLCQQAGHRDRVIFTGAQEVGAHTYQSWAATLICSSYEGSSMAALESMAAGTPCVATPLPALREILGHTAPQWLASEDSAQALAITLTEMLATPLGLRQILAQKIAAQHPQAQFAMNWQRLLCKHTHKPWSGMKIVHFVHAGPAYMPELAAYEQHLAALGHHSQRHADPATVPTDADIVWWICGHVSTHHSHRLRTSLHVHEYASASVGRLPALKDRIKRWRHPRPAHRIFLNDWVRERMGFDDGVPFSLRDMGVPAAFLTSEPRQPPDHDLVYLGEMSRLRAFVPSLRAMSQAGLKLLLVGQLPDDLARTLQILPGVSCSGRVPQAQVPAQLLRARAGLNLMPDRLPVAMQTSTKVLEYLAVGLPVLSNDYPWSRVQAAQYPDRIFLLRDLHLPERWAKAMAALPAQISDRSALGPLAWPELLKALPVWQQLGLSKVPP